MSEATQYKCSQLELYTAAVLIWSSCGQYLGDFKNFKSKYTAEFISEARAAIEAARQIPDQQTRNDATETFGILLAEKAAALRVEWQRLKRYLEEAYPENLLKPKLEAAGQPYYERAGQNNWASVLGLSTAAQNFMTANLGDLLTKGYMPEAFPAKFDKLGVDFRTLQQQFLDSKGIESVGAATKVRANNAIYKSAIAVCKDGQEVFRNDDALAAQFIFEEVLVKIRGGSPSGISGIVTDHNTNLPLANIEVTVDGLNKTTTTDNEGRYEFRPLAAGTYTLTFRQFGRQTRIEQNVEVKSGTTRRLNVTIG